MRHRTPLLLPVKLRRLLAKPLVMLLPLRAMPLLLPVKPLAMPPLLLRAMPLLPLAMPLPLLATLPRPLAKPLRKP